MNQQLGPVEPLNEDIFGVVASSAPTPPAQFHMNSSTLPFPGVTGMPVGVSVVTIDPAEAKTLQLILPTLTIRFQALKVVSESSVVGIVYDNEACDFTLTVSEKYRLRMDEQELQVLYAGGKISFGKVTLLTLITSDK
jgi:hypothetical protein